MALDPSEEGPEDGGEEQEGMRASINGGTAAFRGDGGMFPSWSRSL